MLEQQAKAAMLAPTELVSPMSHSVSTPSLGSSKIKETGYDGSDFQGDEWDFGDNISLQHEVNRLSHEVQCLQTECQHWRSVAGQLSQSGSYDEKQDNKNAELVELQTRVTELDFQLAQSKDHQQHEVASLQDVHAQKVTALKKRHKIEVAEYKQQIAALEQQIADGRDSDSIKHGVSSNLPEADRAGPAFDSQTRDAAIEDLKRELSQLQAQLSTVTAEKDKVMGAKHHLEGVLRKLQSEVDRLQTEQGVYQLKISELDATVLLLKQELMSKQKADEEIQRLTDALEKLGQEKTALEVENQQQLQVKDVVKEVDSRCDVVSEETASIVEAMGSPRHQELTAELINSTEKENLILKEQNLKLQEQITLLEKAAHSQNQEKNQCEDTITELKAQLHQLKGEETMNSDSTTDQSLTSDSERSENQSLVGSDESAVSELSRRNAELDEQVQVLQAQVEQCEHDIEQFEFVKSDWQMEKEALEDVLLQLREQLREKEIALNIAQAQKGLAEVERQEKNFTHNNASSGEAKPVVEEMIVPEEQPLLYTGETNLSGVKAEIAEVTSQAEELSNANLQLEQERDQLEAEKADMEEKVVKLEQKMADLEKRIQELQANPDEQLQKKELESKVEVQTKELMSLHQEKLELETSLEELDLQHQQAMDKLIQIRDDLSHRVDDLSSQLAEKEADIFRLTDELEQSKLERSKDEGDSSRLNESVESTEKTDELRKKVDELLITVDALEKDQESKEKEIEDLKEKCRKGAVAVNELHMDKRELDGELARMKQDIGTKVVKIKEMREENARLAEANKDLKVRLQEMEEELEDWQQVNEENQINQSQTNALKQNLAKIQEENSLLKERLLEFGKSSSEIQTRNSELMAENQRLLGNIEESSRQSSAAAERDMKVQQDKISVMETQLDALTSEKHRLERELNQIEEKSLAQVKHYEKYIQELQQSKELDATSLEQDHQNLLQTCHQKELQMAKLKSQLENLQAELNDTKETLESSVDSQSQLTEILKEKDSEIITLKKDNSGLVSQQEEHLARLREQEELLESMKDMEKHIATSKEEVQHLRSEIMRSKAVAEEKTAEKVDSQRTLEIITQMEKELATANNKLVSLEKEVEKYKETIADHEAGISDLNQRSEKYLNELEMERQKLQRQDDVVLVLQERSVEKDREIKYLQQKLKRAASYLDEKRQQMVEQDEKEMKPNYHLLALDFPEKAAIEYTSSEYDGKADVDSKEQEINEKREINEHDFDYNRKNSCQLAADQVEDISDRIDELRLRLRDKDQIIEELQTNNSSLLKMLETKSLSSPRDKSIVDIHRLENELKSLQMEKEQILAVMNEKSRECSSLKTEVRRLMSVISAEKTALDKLQKDNVLLQQKRESPEREDMQKEAVQNLSRLVRERDLEIDALKQKNETLLAVLQDSSQDTQGTQINSLLQDKENLGKQVMALQSEREQMITYLNQKHQESISYHNEIQRLTAFINTESEKNEKLQEDYANLVPQFEDKKQALLKTQNELVNYKQKFTELEVKYGELLQRSNMMETVDISAYNAKEEEVKRFKEKQTEVVQNLQEKDQKIQVLNQKLFELENSLSSKDAERTNLKKQVENLTFQLQGLQTELQDLKADTLSTEQKTSEQDSENQMLKHLNNQLTLSLHEKEFEINSLQEKSVTLTSLLQEQQGEKGQVDHLIQENGSLHKQALQLQQERDQIMMALKQRQLENEDLQKLIQKLKDRESKLTRELDRLRHHLLQIEEGYTREALEAEEREKDLRNRLAVAEEKLLSSTTAVENASHYASQQFESLQQQLFTVASQRDAAYLQVANMQEQCQQSSASLTNLQLVLEQFTRERDSQVAVETERYQDEIKSLEDQISSLKAALHETKAQLEEASDGLEAAARLSEQLDKKEEAITALKEEVQLRETALKTTEEEIKKLTTSTEAKVDKLLMKNVLLAYFATPQKKRPEVFRMIGGILNFSPEDFMKVEGSEEKSGWVPGFLRFGSGRSTPVTPPTSPVRQMNQGPNLNQSFSQLFVKFLEKESTPPPPPVRLPAEEMARELQEKQKETQKPAFNPFTAPRHVSMPMHVGEQTASMKSHILMSPVTPTLPLLTPMSDESRSQPGSGCSTPSGRSTPQNSSAILKDVLGSR